MSKILVLGSSGSGKSVFARHLSSLLHIPLYHLDCYYWEPNWKPKPEDDWQKIVECMVLKPTWIIDGHFSSSLEIRLKEADQVYLFNFPTLICLWRIILRRIKFHNRARPSVTPGCPEKLNWEFIRWVLTFKKRNRLKLHNLLQKYNTRHKLVLFSHPRQVNAFFKQLSLKLTQKIK